MKVTQDVVRDLLPVYTAGQASADTRAVVEEWLDKDKELAGLSKMLLAEKFPGPSGSAAEFELAAKHEKDTINMTKQLIKRQSRLLGLAIFFTLAPLTFMFDGSKIIFLMVRDAPGSAAVYGALAVVTWIAYWMTRRRIGATGL